MAQRPFPWLYLAVAGCFLYGLVLVLLIHTTADGSWFWYAMALRHGTHLYRDLHLPLQPVYPVELALLQAGLGTSWLAQQSAGVLNLLLFLGALWSVVRFCPGAAWQRALVFAAAFFTCMDFITMRFDDYHVIATAMELFCAALFLQLFQGATVHRVPRLLAIGMLCGLCMLVRINDGGLLLCATLPIAAVTAPSLRSGFVQLLTVAAAACLTVLALIGLIGETPHAWWFYTIYQAAGIKGGSHELLLSPLRLPWGTLHEFSRDWRFAALTAYALLLGALAYLEGSGRFHPSKRVRWALPVVAGLAAVPLLRNILYGNAARVYVAFAVLGIYAASATVLVRLVLAMRGKPAATWQPRELLLFLPLAQLVSIALSAARWYPNTNPAAALFLVLLPAGMPRLLRDKGFRAVFLTSAALLTFSASVDKLHNPFDWFHYRAAAWNAPRIWLRHPVYGPMLLETSQLRLVEPVCTAVRGSSPGKQELLSLPFTFSNYVCAIAPWHGYTQTFYDTSSRATIQALERELQTRPPEWVVYQRQLDILSRNEEAFNGGRPLPHRELDALIVDEIDRHRWTATPLPSPPKDTSTWLLIHTVPAVNGAAAAGAMRSPAAAAGTTEPHNRTPR